MSDYQITWGGLTLGDSTDYDLVEIEGLDMPELRTADSDLAQAHGAVVGADLFAGRTLAATLQVQTTSDTDLAARINSLASAMAPRSDLTAWTVDLPSQATRLAYVRPRSLQYRVGPERTYQRLDALLTWYAPDPRLYDGDTLHAISATVGGASALPNAGSLSSPPVIRVTGPITNPTLTNTAGEVLTYTGTVAASTWIEYDVADRTVLTNLGASVLGNMSGTWWEVPAGGTSITTGGTSTTGATAVLVTYRAAHLTA